MANNIFTGTFYDENGNKIAGNQVRYFGIHRDSQGVVRVSDTRVAEVDMYNFNLIDADWLGNSIPFVSGDQVAIVAWQDESLDKTSTNLQRFSMIFFDQDGRDTYVQDIQLRPKTDPTCNLTLNGEYVNVEVVANSNGNDLYQWTYDNMTHYHRGSIFGHTISSVGILDIEYDFGDGWVSSNRHTYTTSGSKRIQTRVTNAYGGIATCDKSFDIKHRPPSSTISFDVTTPVIYDNIKVSSHTQDTENVITKIEHYWEDVLIDTNTNLNYEYSIVLTVNKTHTAKQVIIWYDGFNTQTLTVTKNLSMGNLPPEFNLIPTLVSSSDTEDKYNFVMDALRDPDGDNSQVNTCWVIEYMTPIDNAYKVVSNPGYSSIISQDPANIAFIVSGTYRVTAKAKDILGATTTKSTIVTVALTGCTTTPVVEDAQQRFIEWE